MKIQRCIVSVIAVFLTACTITNHDDSVFKGHYTWGHEVRSFQPCGSENAYWVKTSPEIQKELFEYHQANTSKPYEAVYIEFEGGVLDDERTGFARDYDGLVRIKTILKTTSTLCTEPQN